MKVVIAIGNPYRRDDGVGPALAELLTQRKLSDVHIEVLDGEPTRLLDAWAGAPLAIVIDAVLCQPAHPGRIHRTNLDQLPAGTPAASSHGLGIPEAVQLGTVLDRLPQRLIVYAVEAADIGFGIDLTPEVAAALPALLDAVLTDVTDDVSGGDDPDD
ncbi:MAG TPA: hydrogenase maturation protease [Actinophytocola sp.]|uniref:hydrogenase maturation protease n=1 Tax=Actinophytocola sp. TaxID=1872138 RepID=UPI002DB9EB9B|nr:hydrogenase maturation protease [Actinophytocola sp.]HEU5469298.1 hydrogenase maturation protease [Actinophytocola sp.]